MGQLVKAEFRKILSTRLWWVLLACTAVLGTLWAGVFGAAGSYLANQLANEPLLQGAGFDTLPFSVFGFARAVNITAVFPMTIGALAIAGENYRKTITTSFLVAPNRAALLWAKLITYAMIGAVYGLVISGVASLGILIGGTSAQLPDAAGWLALFAAGVLSTLVWTLLGVGVGALFGNVIAAVIALLGYTVVLENSLLLVLPTWLDGYLPNNAGDSMTSAIAAQYVFDNTGELGKRLAENSTTNAVVHTVAGSAGDLPWAASAAVFIGWAAVFVAGGWAITRYRDVN